MNPEVDKFLIDGCGRCSLYQTPQCKVHRWPHELRLLRQIVLDTGLEEQIKWGFPCYTLNNANIVMISPFKEHCVLSFFKGVLLNDSEKILENPGENSQSVKFARFTDVKRIEQLETTLKNYIFEAIEVERQGLKPDFKQKDELEYPEELVQKMEHDANFKNAFEALTPGRKRGYILHFTSSKQSKTRMARIEKYAPLILEGKGMHDHYKC
ncbi:MAG: YdeI/OmpD-associated family protein [Flavobacteriales bacterium]|nr:YdeI/OmpD-associated family protein [Flavobacteriales bacterium]